ncbi:6-phosphogluconate dehydrogenase, decarboxylating-like [Culex quinquefasciatus]|uniref:6-phosphogluconate dehydrogenase, decarboxylating-like n=1 Tax=Culex quinquefasciatus TaxID=7176 RepID=UPI0018E2D62B|nr:6-phosphogluconate dehydrogenase, decarboxylating-like [Culex quinquefasciatus]
MLLLAISDNDPVAGLLPLPRSVYGTKLVPIGGLFHLHLKALCRATKPDRKTFLTHIRSAVYCANIVSYGHGFMLLRKAVNEYKWNLNFDGIALMWRGGCIIRSAIGKMLLHSSSKHPNTQNCTVGADSLPKRRFV